MARNGMKVAMLVVLAVVGSACGGAAPESKTQKLGAAGGVITLAATGARIEVPAGAVSSETEFRVTEVEVHGSRRAIHVEARGKLERAMRVHFARPDGVAATETLRVVRVDDKGGELQLSDDAGAMSGAEPGDDNGGAGEVEAGDDKGGAGEVEPGDDNGGAGEVEAGDDKGGAGEVEAGDDKGHDWAGGAAGMSMDDGTFALEIGDDKGGAGEVEAGDDKGGAGEVEAGDDKGGVGEVEPGDDNGMDPAAPAPVDDSGKVG